MEKFKRYVLVNDFSSNKKLKYDKEDKIQFPSLYTSHDYSFYDIWTNSMIGAGSLDQEEWFIKDDILYTTYASCTDIDFDEWDVDSVPKGLVVVASENINDVIKYIIEHELGLVLMKHVNENYFILVDNKNIKEINYCDKLKIITNVKHVVNLIYKIDEFYEKENSSIL